MTTPRVYSTIKHIFTGISVEKDLWNSYFREAYILEREHKHINIHIRKYLVVKYAYNENKVGWCEMEWLGSFLQLTARGGFSKEITVKAGRHFNGNRKNCGWRAFWEEGGVNANISSGDEQSELKEWKE